MTKKAKTVKITERKPKEVEKVNSSGNKRGTSPESLSNLKKDAGPGRPKGKLNYDTRVDMAIEALAIKYAEDQNKKNAKVKGYVPITADDVDIEGDIFMQHINKARGGDRHFIDSFLDRRHGKATQRVEMTGKDGEAMQYEVKVTEAKERARGMLNKWLKK